MNYFLNFSGCLKVNQKTFIQKKKIDQKYLKKNNKKLIKNI